MKRDQVYRCFLTIRSIKKSHDGRKTLDTQLIHIPIMGSKGSEYHIDYHVCLPKYFHLARKSLSVISGQIEVDHGHASLSNNNQAFIYEMNAGVLVVRYINQNYQEVGHGLISRDLGTSLLDVARQVPIPRGYHCDYIAGYRVKQLAQSIVIRVKGNSATLQQSALEIIKREIDRQGNSLRQQVHTIHVSGHIGDSFSLHPADYQFPDAVPAANTADVNGIITPNGVDPVQVRFTYVKLHQTLLSYPLTIKILEKNQDKLDYHTVVKSVRGSLHHRYHYNYRDFQPKGYQLDPGSLKSVDGEITAKGLSHPNVAFIYDQIKTINVKYVNQNHQVVGTSQLYKLDRVLQHLRHYLKPPSGYVLNSHHQPSQNDDGIAVPVHGKVATQKQNAVRLRIIERQPHGQLIGRHPKILHVSGNVGDRFQIDPATQCPSGFLNRKNQPIKGMINVNGTQVSHNTLTYFKQPSAVRILIRCVDQNDQIICQRIFSGMTGHTFDRSWIHKTVPSHYRFVKVVSGDQVHQFGDRDQIILIQVKRAAANQGTTSAANPQATVQSEAAKPQVQKDVAHSAPSSSADQKPQSSAADSQASSSSAQAESQSQSSAAPSQASQSSQSSAPSTVANSTKSSQADRSASASSAAQSIKSSHHINVVEKAFMYRCYGKIFAADLMSRTRHDDQRQVRAGVQLADDYIQGIKDALDNKDENDNRGHSYHYGYQSCKKFAKSQSHPSVTTILMAIMKKSSLIHV